MLRLEHERILLRLLAWSNDRTDVEYALILRALTGVGVSRPTLVRTWKRMKITRKKKDLHATERDKPEIVRQRYLFRRRARRIRHARFIFFDEFGTNLGMTPLFARAPRGQRALGSAPRNPDPQVTLTIGLSREGIVAPMAMVGAMTGDIFSHYMSDWVAPKLRPGDVVLVDGLGAHRAHAARDAVENVGAKYWMLPGYSPDLNPVEEAGSKIKAHVRAENPRTASDLFDVIGDALREVSPQNALGWFSHRASYLMPRAKPS